MTVKHSHEDQKAILNRLSRLSGHLESIRRMVEEERPCMDVLIQLQAVRAAVNSVSRVVLTEHISHHLAHTPKSRSVEALSELNAAIEQILK